MEIKKQVIALIGSVALGVSTHLFAEEPSVESMPVYEGNAPYSSPGYSNPYAQPPGPAEAGLIANEEDDPDNTASMPTPQGVGPAEEAVQNDNEESYTDPY